MKNDIVNDITSKDAILYVVATPIGNLQDMTFRAVKVLEEVDLIACENTLSSQKLFQYYGIKNNCTEYSEKNADKVRFKLLSKLISGHSIALISEAGTPLISDPGYKLVKEALAQGIKVSTLPGATSAIAALSISGLPTDKFLFMGFFPTSQQEKIRRLQEIQQLPYTTIFFESPRRLIQTLSDMREVLNSGKIAVVKEITKAYEHVYAGTIDEVIKQLDGKLYGEYVIVVDGDNAAGTSEHDITIMLKALLQEGMKLSQAVKETSASLNIPKKKVYNLALQLQGK